MNGKNYEYLKEQLKMTEFSETLNTELANKMSQGTPEFQLSQKNNYGKDTAISTLHFKKGEGSDMYFFNRYDLQVQNAKGENKAAQTFYINKGSSITQKEGYNLLEGRAVHKTLTNKGNEKYDAWVQLNFKTTSQNGNYEIKQYHQNYGYDLDKVLARYPIKELQQEESKQQLVRSLERGNLQAATFEIGGKQEKLFITANVAFKTLTAYSNTGQRVSLKDSFQTQQQENKPEQTVTKEQKPEQKEQQNENRKSVTNADKDDRPVQKRSRKQKM